MKKRILCVILSLVAVFSLVGFNATQAWFSDGKNKGLELKSGNLNFSATGDLSLKDENAVVIPGATLELKEAIVITNNSTIDTELRIRTECTYDGATEDFRWIEFVSDESGKWEVGDDGYIYYCPNGTGSSDRRIPAVEVEETEATTAAEATTDEASVVNDETTTETTTEKTTYAENEIPFAGTMKISGDVPIDMQGKEMTIRFILEAKQADFVEWEYFSQVTE